MGINKYEENAVTPFIKLKLQLTYLYEETDCYTFVLRTFLYSMHVRGIKS